MESVKRAAGTQEFVVQPRRWVVERTFGLFGRYRGLSKDYEQLPQSSEAMVLIAMIQLMLKRLEPIVRPSHTGSNVGISHPI